MSNNNHHHRLGRLSRLGAIILVVLALGTMGCSGDDPTSPTVPEAFDHAESRTVDGLKLSVSTSQATYVFGDEVTIRMTLTNVSDQPQVLDFSRGNPARFLNLNLNVDNADGTALHVAGDGERDNFPLAPGEAISATFIWDQGSRFGGNPVERGFYSVVAFVGFDDRDTLRVTDLFIELD